MPAPERTLGSVPGAPTPYLNAYSLVVRSTGDRIHLAGCMGDDPETGEIVEGGCEAQAVSAAHRSDLIQFHAVALLTR